MKLTPETILAGAIAAILAPAMVFATSGGGGGGGQCYELVPAERCQDGNPAGANCALDQKVCDTDCYEPSGGGFISLSLRQSTRISCRTYDGADVSEADCGFVEFFEDVCNNGDGTCCKVFLPAEPVSITQEFCTTGSPGICNPMGM
jgi:hypothetical protein